MEDKKTIVVIGGGTGTHTVLKGLKRFAEQVDIVAVISMADSGGSTGRLRDEFGQLPVGDVRMALAALARDYQKHEELLRELFLYRFEKGDGLSGHNFGNLLLTALTDILGSEAEAVKAASKILRIRGTVLPVTADDVHLVATYDDNLFVKGEHVIDDPKSDRRGKRVTHLSTEPIGKISPEAAEAIVKADLIVIGPGDLYSSLLANFVIIGAPEAVKENKGKIIYVSNLMERPGQTENMSVSDCCDELSRYVGRYPDLVFINDAPLPADVVAEYQRKEGVKPVTDDSSKISAKVVKCDLITHEIVKQQKTDSLKRSLIRHDSDKLAKTIVSFL